MEAQQVVREAQGAFEESTRCSICLEIFSAPHRTGCGHTFCGLCLARWTDHNSTCPSCRQSLDVIQPDFGVGNMLDALALPLLDRTSKEEWEERKREWDAEKAAVNGRWAEIGLMGNPNPHRHGRQQNFEGSQEFGFQDRHMGQRSLEEVFPGVFSPDPPSLDFSDRRRRMEEPRPSLISPHFHHLPYSGMWSGGHYYNNGAIRSVADRFQELESGVRISQPQPTDEIPFDSDNDFSQSQSTDEDPLDYSDGDGSSGDVTSSDRGASPSRSLFADELFGNSQHDLAAQQSRETVPSSQQFRPFGEGVPPRPTALDNLYIVNNMSASRRGYETVPDRFEHAFQSLVASSDRISVRPPAQDPLVLSDPDRHPNPHANRNEWWTSLEREPMNWDMGVNRGNPPGGRGPVPMGHGETAAQPIDLVSDSDGDEDPNDRRSQFELRALQENIANVRDNIEQVARIFGHRSQVETMPPHQDRRVDYPWLASAESRGWSANNGGYVDEGSLYEEDSEYLSDTDSEGDDCDDCDDCDDMDVADDDETPKWGDPDFAENEEDEELLPTDDDDDQDLPSEDERSDLWDVRDTRYDEYGCWNSKFGH